MSYASIVEWVHPNHSNQQVFANQVDLMVIYISLADWDHAPMIFAVSSMILL